MALIKDGSVSSNFDIKPGKLTENPSLKYPGPKLENVPNKGTDYADSKKAYPTGGNPVSK